MPRQRISAVGLSFAIALGFSDSAASQAYPSRPVTLIVPYAPGGSSDAIARIITEAMRSSLGQPVIIDNVPGASGSIGTGRVARAAPDGYTIGLGGPTTHVVNGAVLKIPYDVLASFEPVSLLPTMPLLVVAKKEIPATN